MIKCLVIDDEPLARSIVLEYLRAHPEVQVVQECSDGFEGVKAIMQHQPDLIFLDVQMPKINGFEMLELVEQVPGVIFTTAFDAYAIKAFEANAVDYLLKPFSQERFDAALKKWLGSRSATALGAGPAVLEAMIAKQPEEHLRIVVKDGQNIRIIPVNDVLYLEAYDDYVRIHTKEGLFLKKKTMGWYEQALNPRQFVRVHRSFILALAQLTRIEPFEKDSHVALLRNGERIPLSRSGYSKLRAVLGI
ncbi:LytTR family two component transcriptional regulator [Pontibacter ummariensis]|uniref:Two component transcriptional regulator, LytTR family n=1 Tax=Pontibacter ummariensis TaxID=1610492 RepID=A0A239L1L1_9BACT|nr:response regulator [Pontibacter ummariensis]PRY04609.1 LytTR family two component transcriptional regulator [Pontibacter ummariensis]SNT24195.1 two component transcriptional regulator, LytTR family [Pontibacter ummariensis]